MKKLLSILLFLCSNHVFPAAQQPAALHQSSSPGINYVLCSETGFSDTCAVYFVGTTDYVVLTKWFEKSLSATGKIFSATLYEKCNKETDEYRETNIETTQERFDKEFARAKRINQKLKSKSGELKPLRRFYS